MIAVDTNLLVYSHRSDSPFHQVAKELIAALRAGPAAWAIPWPCVHEFVAMVTHPKVFKTPTPLAASFACVDAWLAGGNLHLIGEGEGLFREVALARHGSTVERPAHSRRSYCCVVSASRRE